MLSVFNIVRVAAMVAVMVLVWAIFGMVYLEIFVYPFNNLMFYLMPWKKLYTIPATAELPERMAIMENILETSGRIADLSLFAVIVCFAMLSGYMTFVYQQRQRRVQENKMLIVKNQEISRRNEFIRYISATISHEFKNNLGRIKRRLDLLTDLSPEVRQRIDSNFEKLFADIDIFKKIADEREASLVQFTKVDLRQLLLEMSSLYSDFAEIRFSPGTVSGHTTIFASRPLLKTVFENLIDNSIKYKKPEQPRARITLSCSEDVDGTRRYVSLSFKDEGIGMDEAQADQCFYKGKKTDRGWGEGLYFAKYVIGLHAGKIRVGKEYTAPGVGTEIIIHLPFIEESINV